MKTFRAIVQVRYQFEFESDFDKRRELQDMVEDIWNQKVDLGIEDNHHQETDIYFREVC